MKLSKIAYKELLLISILYLISLALCLAQEESVLNPTTYSYENYSKVMIIPFNDNYYFSEADNDLAEHNNLDPKEVSRQFKEGLDFNVNVRILSQYDTKQLLKDENEDVAKDLENIYSGVRYSLKKVPRTELLVDYDHEKHESNVNQDNFFTKMANKLHIETNHDQAKSEGFQDEARTIESVDLKEYMAAEIQHPEMLQYLNEKYETDLFVFINQFELKNKYELCLDRANNKFTRVLYVHFSIFDKEADLVYGDVVKVEIESNSNDMDLLIRNNFPIVADYLASYLPKQKQTVTN